MAKKRGPKKNPNSKRSQGVDRHLWRRTVVHIEPDTFQAIEDYRAAQEASPPRAEVIRLALREFFKMRKFLPLRPRPIRPDE